jgi:hypothetical protein
VTASMLRDERPEARPESRLRAAAEERTGRPRVVVPSGRRLAAVMLDLGTRHTI